MTKEQKISGLKLRVCRTLHEAMPKVNQAKDVKVELLGIIMKMNNYIVELERMK